MGNGILKNPKRKAQNASKIKQFFVMGKRERLGVIVNPSLYFWDIAHGASRNGVRLRVRWRSFRRAWTPTAVCAWGENDSTIVLMICCLYAYATSSNIIKIKYNIKYWRCLFFGYAFWVYFSFWNVCYLVEMIALP